MYRTLIEIAEIPRELLPRSLTLGRIVRVGETDGGPSNPAAIYAPREDLLDTILDLLAIAHSGRTSEDSYLRTSSRPTLDSQKSFEIPQRKHL